MLNEGKRADARSSPPFISHSQARNALSDEGYDPISRTFRAKFNHIGSILDQFGPHFQSFLIQYLDLLSADIIFWHESIYFRPSVKKPSYWHPPMMCPELSEGAKTIQEDYSITCTISFSLTQKHSYRLFSRLLEMYLLLRVCSIKMWTFWFDFYFVILICLWFSIS